MGQYMGGGGFNPGAGNWQQYGGAPGGDFSGFGGGTTYNDLGDIFNLFGGSAKRRTATRTKGDDITYNVHLTFDEALKGKTVEFLMNREEACVSCGGTGAAPGSNRHVCQVCSGSGYVSDNQGLFGISRACPSCRGRGSVVDKPCNVCSAAGSVLRPRTETVKLPAGVTDGSKLKFKGRGQASRDGGPSGDLFIVVKVAPHPYFKRSKSDVLLDAPITFAEAALGANIEVPTIDGTVSLKIPPGTKDGQVFRLGNKGAQKIKGTSRGDMLVTVRIEVPKELSANEKELLLRFADSRKDNPRAKFKK
jgi:molecular chaperone DnaJ